MKKYSDLSMFVGGEFYEDDRWVSEVPSLVDEGMYFLNGGGACLKVISDYLCAKKIAKVLLPDYLCPSILDVFEKNSLQFTFYRVKDNLEIDLDDLMDKASVHQVVYYINYFGFSPSPVIYQALKSLQDHGILLIEDNCHGGPFGRFLGDFVFNSWRKVCAVDGAYMATRINLSPYLLQYITASSQRLPVIRAYRRQLRSYLLEGRGRRSELERLFYQAEHYYENELVVIGNPEEHEKTKRLDWRAIKEVRSENFNYLLERISEIPLLKPIFRALQPNIMPMGFPVLLDERVSRDWLLEQLSEDSISLTVHWDSLLTDHRLSENRHSLDLAAKIFTLPVDQYTSKSQLDYLLDRISDKINNV